jgi:hypothetical protein
MYNPIISGNASMSQQNFMTSKNNDSIGVNSINSKKYEDFALKISKLFNINITELEGLYERLKIEK